MRMARDGCFLYEDGGIWNHYAFYRSSQICVRREI